MFSGQHFRQTTYEKKYHFDLTGLVKQIFSTITNIYHIHLEGLPVHEKLAQANEILSNTLE